jgi:hypothetical protein
MTLLQPQLPQAITPDQGIGSLEQQRMVYTFRSSLQYVYLVCAATPEEAARLLCEYNPKFLVGRMRPYHMLGGGPDGSCMASPKRLREPMDRLINAGWDVVWQPGNGVPEVSSNLV